MDERRHTWNKINNHTREKLAINIATILWMWITFQSSLTVSPSHFQQKYIHSLSPQPRMCRFKIFHIILLFIPPSISLSWCSVVDGKLTPLGGTRLWHHTWQQPEVSLGKIVVYEAQDALSFLQISQQSCSLSVQINTKRWRENQRNGIEKCCELYSNLHRLHECHSSCANH